MLLSFLLTSNAAVKMFKTIDSQFFMSDLIVFGLLVCMFRGDFGHFSRIAKVMKGNAYFQPMIIIRTYYFGTYF